MFLGTHEGNVTHQGYLYKSKREYWWNWDSHQSGWIILWGDRNVNVVKSGLCCYISTGGDGGNWTHVQKNRQMQWYKLSQFD